MSTEALVAAIHSLPIRIGLAITGGGSQAIADLLAVPGGSHTVVEAQVPYADRAVDRLLGARPEHYCDEWTARAMAMAAFVRARSLADPLADAARWLGIGATASLVSSRPKLGPHRLHVAIQSIEATRVTSIEFVKQVRSRRGEERLAADVILNELAAEVGVAERLALDLLPDECQRSSRLEAPAAWRELLWGERHVVLAPDRPEGSKAQRTGRMIMPGAFHPLHDGHRRIREIAASRLGRTIEVELSVWNVDKPPLDYLEIDRRVRQFAASETVWLTRAPTFVEKIRLFPAATFVVGADTIERIGQARYYQCSDVARDAAIDELARSGARFLVFGRQSNGTFRALDDLPLPAALRALCTGVDEHDFRIDLSSTQLRGC